MADINEESGSGMVALWSRLGATARATLITGIALTLMLAVLLMWWVMRTDYQVLFSNLEPADAGAVVQALKTQKVAYRLENQGRTIAVPADRVYETRLALMSSGTPLSGGVGFEIFDRQGLGATEQSQRITYQRALQGELARTIGALEHVRQARVFLVLPESTLFKRDQQKARAAVSLTLEPGTQLQNEQIMGVQRLVAAAVSGLDVDQVVVTDQRGITLSASSDPSLQGAGGGTRLKLKTELEDYFVRKITTMLERVVGPGKSIVSVDATLNFDQITRSMQLLVPLDENDPSKSGAILHRRETHDHPGSADDSGGDTKSTTNSSIEVDYEYGKKLEQVATAPGALARLSVSVVVPGEMTPERQARLLQLIRAAAGTDASRGDTVVLDSLDSVTAPVSNTNLGVSAAPEDEGHSVTQKPMVRSATWLQSKLVIAAVVVLGILMIAAIALLFAMRRQRGNLSVAARDELLSDILAALQSNRADGQSRI